jgi:hypothetical protein
LFWRGASHQTLCWLLQSALVSLMMAHWDIALRSGQFTISIFPVKQALKEAFLKTDSDLRTPAGHAECLKIRKEVGIPNLSLVRTLIRPETISEARWRCIRAAPTTRRRRRRNGASSVHRLPLCWRGSSPPFASADACAGNRARRTSVCAVQRQILTAGLGRARIAMAVG